MLLREHPEDEASFAVRFKCGGDDDVLSRRQLEPIAHLPQVDEGLTASHRRLRQEDVRTKVHVGETFKLTTEEELVLLLYFKKLSREFDSLLLISPHQEPEERKQTKVRNTGRHISVSVAVSFSVSILGIISQKNVYRRNWKLCLDDTTKRQHSNSVHVFLV